jgi:thiosulfate dehydrogenase (quinone) large subunit
MNAFKTAFTRPAFTGLMWLVIRFYVGYEFLTAGWEKIESGKWIGGDGISAFLKGALAKNTGAHPEVQGWYVDLVKNVFMPNATLFSTLVALGEVVVGVALILGIFTKFAALSGAVMNLAFVSAGVSSSNPQLIAFQVAMLFAGAGVAFYGIDRYLLPYLKHFFTTASVSEKKLRPGIGTLPAPRPVR